MKHLKTILATLLVLVFIIMTGCAAEQGLPKSSDGADKAKSSSAAIDSNATDKTTGKSAVNMVKVYFPSEDGSKLIVKEKPASPEYDKYTAAMKALLQGSRDQGVATIIPEGTQLQGIKVDKNIAYVSFNAAMVKKFNGGSTGELMLVSSIVNTLTEFPEIKSVQILIDGKKVETLSGHLDLTEPMKRF